MTSSIVTIKSGGDLVDLLNEKLHLNNKTGIPCPYCGEGEDRFVLLSGPYNGREFDNDLAVRFMCRVQARKAPEDRKHQPVYSAAQVLREKALVFIELDGDLSWPDIAASLPRLEGTATGSAGGVSSRLRMKTLYEVAQDHLDGAETWHAETVFDQLTIHQFRLGMAMWFNGFERLTIPIPVPVEWTGKQLYMPKGRRHDPRDPLARKYDLPRGAPPILFESWTDRTGAPIYSPEAYTIGEGEKSTMALWQMGFGPVGTTTAGAGVWLEEWTKAILERGPLSLNIIGDNDAAGDAFAKKVYLSFKRALSLQPDLLDEFQIRVAAWPNFGDATDRDKRDPYDVLEEHGEAARSVIDSLLVNAEQLFNPRPDLMQVDPEEVIPLEDLRGEGDDGLYTMLLDFYTRYRKDFYTRAKEIDDIEESGTVRVERTAAGVGKTRAAVRLAETVGVQVEMDARKKDEQREKRRQVARERLALLDVDSAETDSDTGGGDSRERLQQICNLPDAPRNGVLYIAPFRESWQDILRIRQRPELWFPLEARNQENCQYHEVQAAVAAKGYTVMGRLCNGICPFADVCREQKGQYMQQFEEMRKYPIVFLRHPHLLMKELSSGSKLVIIDEDPHGQFLKPREVYADEIDTPDRLRELLEEDFEERQVYYVLALAEALDKTLASAKHDAADVLRSGPDVLRLLNAQLATTMYGVFDLLELCQWIEPEILDRIDKRTPQELLNPATVHQAPSGDFARLFRVVVEEVLAHYQKMLVDIDYTWNSRLNVVKRQDAGPRRDMPVFVFYSLDPFPIPLKTPVIALDATGSPVKYEKSLRRAVFDHRSQVRHPDTKTVVFTGSGFSISSVRRVDEGVASIDALLTRDEWAGPLPVELQEDTLSTSAAINDSLKVLQEVADRHDNLLVVTYMALEAKLKKETWALGWSVAGKLRWGHFRALRGSNAFEDLEAVLIIGTPRPPLRETAMAMSALFYNDPDPLDFLLGPTWGPHHADGALPPSMIKQFADSRLHPLIEEIEAGEILQCLSRIRPHTSPEGKTVYLLTERPAAYWTTHLVPYRTVTAQFDTKACAEIVRAADVRPTVTNVRRALADAGLTVGERKGRAVAAYLRDPRTLTDWMETAIIPMQQGEDNE
jgi:hypothetical protein